MVVGLTGVFLRCGLRPRLFRRRLQIVLVLPQPRLDFVHDAQVADVFHALRTFPMNLPIRVQVHICRRKISQSRLLPGESGRAQQYDEGGHDAPRSIGQLRRSQSADEIQERFPTRYGLARSERLMEDGVDEPRRRLDFRHGVHFAYPALYTPEEAAPLAPPPPRTSAPR